jgi:hypothetical protein
MDFLKDLIQTENPSNLLIISTRSSVNFVSSLEELSIEEIQIQPSIISGDEDTGYFDLMIIFPEIACNKDQLGIAKNKLTKSIVLLRDNKASSQEFSELGFISADNDEIKQSKNFYTYNLKNYNAKRNWNNAEGWANPENFDKFRW